MDPYKDEHLSERSLDEISSLFTLMTGSSSKDLPGPAPNNDVVTVSVLELHMRRMEEKFEREMRLQMEQLKKVEEKCNVILVKVPILENRTEEVATLKKELRMEIERRHENEKSFLECVDKLTEEIVQSNLKVIVLEGRIGEMEKVKERIDSIEEASATSALTQLEEPVPSSSSQTQSNEVVGLINDLSKEIQSKFQEFGESQATLRVKIENTRKDLMESLNYSVPVPPVEAVLDETPQVSHVETEAGEIINMGGVSVSMEEGESSEKFPAIVSTASLAEVGVISPTIRQPSDEEGIEVVHGKASTPGRYLPFLCLCGLEYGSVDSLSDHVVEEVVKRVRVESRGNGSRRPGKGKRKRKPSTSARRSQRRRNPTPKLKSSLATVESIVTTAQNDDNPDVLHGLAKRLFCRGGRKKFLCKCGSSYTALTSLNRHIQTVSRSTGASSAPVSTAIKLKIINCTLCPNKFSILQGLRQHMKVVHKMEYSKGKKSCVSCGDTFATLNELREHRSNIHGFPAHLL